jgi:hypothetical protein
MSFPRRRESNQPLRYLNYSSLFNGSIELITSVYLLNVFGFPPTRERQIDRFYEKTELIEILYLQRLFFRAIASF